MAEDRRWDLIQAALNGEGLDQLADRAAVFLGNPLVIIDTTGTILTHSRSIPSPDDTWNNALDRGYITLEFIGTLSNWSRLQDTGSRYDQMTVHQINAHRRRFFRLILHGQLLGYLNILEIQRPLEDLGEEDPHFVVQLLAKELFAQQAAGGTGRGNQRVELLLGLIRDRFKSRGQLLDQMHLARVPTDLTCRVICSDLRDFLSYNAGEDLFQLELARLFPGSIAAISDQTLFLLVPDEGDIPRRAEDFLVQKKLLFGVSDPFGDLFQFRQYCRQALDALRFRPYLTEPPCRSTLYDEVKLFAILHRIPRRELLQYCGTDVYTIHQYDAAHDTEYLETLYCYLRQDRSVKATAGEMHLHRNTINYRVGRLRELFHLDLEDVSATCRMLVSCELLRMYLAGTDEADPAPRG